MVLFVMKRPGDSMTISVHFLVTILVMVLVVESTIARNGAMLQAMIV